MSSKDWLFLSILTFLTVMAWIVADTYHAATTSTLTPVQKNLIEPLKPTFDQELILKLKARQAVNVP